MVMAMVKLTTTTKSASEDKEEDEDEEDGGGLCAKLDTYIGLHRSKKQTQDFGKNQPLLWKVTLPQSTIREQSLRGRQCRPSRTKTATRKTCHARHGQLKQATLRTRVSSCISRHLHG